MYYNRFGNTVNYLVANFPEQVASMSMAQQNSIAQTQARIDKLNSDFASYKNQVDSNVAAINTLKQEAAELKTKE